MRTPSRFIHFIQLVFDRLTGKADRFTAPGPGSSPAADPKARLEARLREQEERTRSILASMHEVVWSFSPGFEKLLYVNQATEAVFGRASENFLSQPDLWLSIIHPADRPLVEEAIQGYGGLSWTEFTYRILHPNGDVRWIRSRSHVVRDAGGNAARVDGVCVDITEQKMLEDVLKNRDAVLNAVGWAAGRLLSSTSWEEVLPEMLARLGHAIQASRAYFTQTIKREPGKVCVKRLCEWDAEGILPLSRPGGGDTQPLPDSIFGLWGDELSAGQIVQKRASQFSEKERCFFEPLGVSSLVVVPVLLEGYWWGAFGFDDCRGERHWLPAEEEALRAASHMLASAILRQQAEEQLQHLLEEEREQRRASEAIREIAIQFNQSLNYDRILDLVLEQLPRVVPYDGACVLLVMDDKAYVARQRGYEHLQEGDPTEAEPGIRLTEPFRSPGQDRSFQPIFAGLSLEIGNVPNLREVRETHQTKILGDAQADPNWVRVINIWPYHAWIGSPLVNEGQVEAILSLDKLEPYFYTRAHIERLALFTSQASLALHNARLFSETMTALEREEHMSEIARAISSELDLATILRSVVRLAVELAEADAGSISILDPEAQVLRDKYLYNLPQELGQIVASPGDSLAWESVLTHCSILLKDYSLHPKADPRWIQAGVRAFIGVPIIVGNTSLGGLGIFSYDLKKEFEPRQLALVEMVGRQAGVAIQNARLFEAAQRRAVEAETLRQAASAVNSALTLDEVLEKILVQLESVVPYDSAAIFLVEDKYLRVKAGRGFADLPSLMAQRFSIHNPLIDTVENQNAPVIITDAQLDPRFEKWGERDDVHGWMGLSLRARTDRIGYLSIDSHKVGAYTQADADLAQAFADEVSIAIENARLFEQVQRLAITDPLTNIYNRRYFFEGARREFERARRYKLPLSVILLDLDHFKQVNDTFGHLAGDRVLVAVASRCRGVLREVDVLARYGGEEFILLLPQTDIVGARQVAERLHRQIMDLTVDAGGQRIWVSASLGLAEQDDTCLDLQDLVHHADLALYRTKNSGRGNISIWDGEGN